MTADVYRPFPQMILFGQLTGDKCSAGRLRFSDVVRRDPRSENQVR